MSASAPTASVIPPITRPISAVLAALPAVVDNLPTPVSTRAFASNRSHFSLPAWPLTVSPVSLFVQLAFSPSPLVYVPVPSGSSTSVPAGTSVALCLA